MQPEDIDPDKFRSVQVLDRAFAVLDLLAKNQTPMALHEIASATGFHPSTTHRLLWNLASRGYLERINGTNWMLGMRFLEMGNLVRDRISVREKALPLMQVLHERTQQTICLSVRRGDNIVYVEHVFAPLTGIQLTKQIGATAPLHCTSAGKLFLSECTPQEVSDYIGRTQLRLRTSASISTAERLIIELNRIRDLGWSEDHEELENGIQCLGAAVRDASGKIVAAVTVVSNTGMRQKSEWVDQLRKTTEAISASMGWLGHQSKRRGSL